MDVNERLRRAIDTIQKHEKTINKYQAEIEKLNQLVLTNVNTINQLYDEDRNKDERIKALTAENEELISALNKAEELTQKLQHDAQIGNMFKELVKTIESVDNKPRV